MRVAYVGAGRLGLPLAAWSALCGHEVWAADTDPARVLAINLGQVPDKEPRVHGIVRRAVAERCLCATTDIAMAGQWAELVRVLVPTPSQADGTFSNEHVLAACEEIGQGLQRSQHEYPVVEIASTVMPGSTGGEVREALERASGRVADRHFGLVYSPEFVRQGSIVQDFNEPDMLLIGSESQRAADIVEGYHRSIVGQGPRAYHMNLASAEIAKLGLNVSVVAKMQLANQLALVCDALEGADAHAVLKAIGADRRIGHSYFEAGVWPGGPCFPRDTRALRVLATELQVPTCLIDGVDAFSAEMVAWLAGMIKHLAPGQSWQPTVGILGLAYKPGVGLIDASPGLLLARALYGQHIPSFTHDPMAIDPSTRRQGALDATLDRSDVVVIMTCWPEYRHLGEHDLSGKIVIDMWGFLDPHTLNCERYIRFGGKA